MVYKVVFLLNLGASQVAAALIMPRSVLEFLSTRQSALTACRSVCKIFEDAMTNCPTIQCMCGDSVSTSLQACVTCYVTSAPTPGVIDAAKQLIDTHKGACPNATVTIPAIASDTGRVTTAVSPTTAISDIGRHTLTQVTVETSSTSSSATATGGDNTFGLAPSRSSKAADVRRALVVAVGVIIGAALVF